MFTLENPIDFLKFNNNNVFEIFGNNQIEEKEEKEIQPQYEQVAVAPEDILELGDFNIFDEKDLGTDLLEEGSFIQTKEQSFPSEDCNLSSKCSTSQSHIQIDFDGEHPNMDDFVLKIRDEMSSRGVLEVVCDALDIKNNDEFCLEPVEIIKVKKRKTKEQKIQLEAEFAKNDDWTKEFMNKISGELNLAPSQVYKWHWDQISKKLGKAPKRQTKLKKLQNKRKRTSKASNSRNKRART